MRYFYFLSNETKTIHPSLSPDKFFWLPSPNGHFNSNSAYLIALNLDPNHPIPPKWKWLWKLPTLPKITTFLLLACHSCLPTKDLLLKRKILSKATCPLYKNPTESIFYILRDCPIVYPIWANLGNLPRQQDFHSSQILDWIKKMTSYFGTTLFLPNIPWNVAFPIAIWTIWTARNKFVMENKAFVTSEILKKIQALSIDIFFSLPINDGKPHCGSVHISWNPLPRGFFKLNTDGLVNGNLLETLWAKQILAGLLETLWEIGSEASLNT